MVCKIHLSHFNIYICMMSDILISSVQFYNRLMVNFVYQLDWTMGWSLISDKIFFECVLRVFPEKTGIWIGELSKAECRTSCSPECLNRIKRWRKEGFALFIWRLSWDKDLPPALLVLRPSDSEWNPHLLLSSFQGFELHH